MREFREGEDEDVGGTGMFKVVADPTRTSAIQGGLTSVDKDLLSGVDLASLAWFMSLDWGGSVVLNETDEGIPLSTRAEVYLILLNFKKNCRVITFFWNRDVTLWLVSVKPSGKKGMFVVRANYKEGAEIFGDHANRLVFKVLDGKIVECNDPDHVKIFLETIVRIMD